MSDSLPTLLEIARTAGERASKICRAVLDGTPLSLEKGDKSPVTLADYGCQAVILREVAAAFPDHTIVAEEGSEHLKETAGDAGAKQIVELVSDNLGEEVNFDQVCAWIDHQGTGNSEYTWSIDPIDGTKGFLRREQYAVAIGIMKNNVPYAGVLACPNLPVDLNQPDGPRGVLYVAAKGQGTTRVPLDGGEATPVHTNAKADAAACRVLGSVESAHGDPSLIISMMEEAGIEGGFVRYDSQAKYGILAEGNAEIYVRPRSRPDYRENIWDHAAGVIVAEEAGGKVTDLDGKPLDFTLGNTLKENRGVLATASAEIHNFVVKGLQLAEAKN
ncbi:MAG: inositol monophosphatase family protein [Planctomycetota bacterium]|nr:inositol monophosphatase family protein [Planctomycetota bacterium]